MATGLAELQSNGLSVTEARDALAGRRSVCLGLCVWGGEGWRRMEAELQSNGLSVFEARDALASRKCALVCVGGGGLGRCSLLQVCGCLPRTESTVLKAPVCPYNHNTHKF